MILRVTIEEFPTAARRYAQTNEAFVADVPGGVSVTAVNVADDVMVIATTEEPTDGVRALLEAQGLAVREGQWSSDLDEPGDALADIHIAAVAYKSSELMPGIWMEAYPSLPTPAEVLADLYQEFVATGEMRDIGIEEFKKLATPNVLILGPEEIRSFALKQQPLTQR